MGAPHVHNWALSALVEASGETKSEIARRAQLTPGGLSDLLTARRAGTRQQVRDRVAESLDVDVRAITCWCDDRTGNHQEQA